MSDIAFSLLAVRVSGQSPRWWDSAERGPGSSPCAGPGWQPDWDDFESTMRLDPRVHGRIQVALTDAADLLKARASGCVGSAVMSVAPTARPAAGGGLDELKAERPGLCQHAVKRARSATTPASAVSPPSPALAGGKRGTARLTQPAVDTDLVASASSHGPHQAGLAAAANLRPAGFPFRVAPR